MPTLPRPASLVRAAALIVLLAGATAAEARAQLFTMPLPELPPNQEILVVEVTMQPGQASPPHRHNAHVFVYVIEGTIQMQVEGGELRTLSAGETFYENREDVHVVSRNPSDTDTARFLATIIKTIGEPVSQPVGGSEAPTNPHAPIRAAEGSALPTGAGR